MFLFHKKIIDLSIYLFKNKNNVNNLINYITIIPLFLFFIFYSSITFLFYYFFDSNEFQLLLLLTFFSELMSFFIIVNSSKSLFKINLDLNYINDELVNSHLDIYLYILDKLNNKNKIQFLSNIIDHFNIDLNLLKKLNKEQMSSPFKKQPEMTKKQRLVFNIDKELKRRKINLEKRQAFNNTEWMKYLEKEIFRKVIKEKILLSQIYSNNNHYLFEFNKNIKKTNDKKEINKKELKIENL